MVENNVRLLTLSARLLADALCAQAGVSHLQIAESVRFYNRISGLKILVDSLLAAAYFELASLKSERHDLMPVGKACYGLVTFEGRTRFAN